MRQNRYYHYYVEGEDDRKVVNTLKTDMQKIIPGKVEKFNVVEKLIKKMQIMNLKKGTTVVLIFDTDTGKVDILHKNIEFLWKQKMVKEVICVTQVTNLEDELVRSCHIKHIKDLTKSKSDKDFKKDVLKISNLKQRLDVCGFDFGEFWSKEPEGVYNGIVNEAAKVKI